jgi:phage-related minor tail protein
MDNLEILYTEIKELRNDVKLILQRLTAVEVKSAIFGSIAGGIIAVLINWFSK